FGAWDYAEDLLDDELVDSLPEEVFELVMSNAAEELVAEGRVSLPGEEPIPCAHLLLGPGAPGSDPEAGQLIERLASTPPGVYRVLEAVAGAGLWMEDLVEGGQVWVWAPEAAATLGEGDELGARVLPAAPAATLGVAFYPLYDGWGPVVAEHLRDPSGLRRASAMGLDLPAELADAEPGRGEALMGAWIGMLFSPEEEGSEGEALGAPEALYDGWAETYSEELGATPAAAVATSEGRAAVASQLQALQEIEERLAEEEGRSPADLGFLWQEVGLPRP
ncbi:MAG: hypothetical protein MI919_38195, partial [Holophagales bacterium]|nr:hypothetical protein [Holophagales bacterium]